MTMHSYIGMCVLELKGQNLVYVVITVICQHCMNSNFLSNYFI